MCAWHLQSKSWKGSHVFQNPRRAAVGFTEIKNLENDVLDDISITGVNILS